MVLHGRDSSTVLHCSPPFSGLCWIARVFDCKPPSHSAVHLDQPDHMDMWQSTGQRYCPQRLYFSINGHLMPQSSLDAIGFRLIICQPPHLNGWLGSQESSQLTEHCCGIHESMTQSWIKAEGQVVLFSSTALRTVLMAHMS